MRIVIPILGFSRSGGGRVLCKFASEWVSAGHVVDFLVNSNSDEPYFPTQANIIWINNWGRRISPEERSEGRPCRFNGWINLFSLWIGLFRLPTKYDITLANHSLTAWPVAWSPSRPTNKVYYIQMYEPEGYMLEKGLKARIITWLSRRSYDFRLKQIVNAPVYFDYPGIKTSDWVPPGLDFNLFYPRKLKESFKNDEQIVLGCIGRRDPAKGIQFVLSAFITLWEKDKRYRLHVAYGNLPDGWEHPGVTIVIPQNDSELSAFYRSLDIMVAPGIVQLGAPHYPVMEAMACGVPVVTTGYLPACPDNAWIVPIEDAGAIVLAVEDITNRPDRVEERVAKGLTAISAFGWEPAARKILDIFRTGF